MTSISARAPVPAQKEGLPDATLDQSVVQEHAFKRLASLIDTAVFILMSLKLIFLFCGSLPQSTVVASVPRFLHFTTRQVFLAVRDPPQSTLTSRQRNLNHKPYNLNPDKQARDPAETASTSLAHQSPRCMRVLIL